MWLSGCAEPGPGAELPTLPQHGGRMAGALIPTVARTDVVPLPFAAKHCNMRLSLPPPPANRTFSHIVSGKCQRCNVSQFS